MDTRDKRGHDGSETNTSMSWLVFAFSAPVFWAISTHLDKYLVERYFKYSNVAVLLLFTALTGLAFAPLVWIFDPGVTALPLDSIALMTLSGLLYMAGLFFYLQALQMEEASVVAPFSQASPIFGFALAYIFLGETLTAKQMAGGALIIVGATVVGVGTGIGYAAIPSLINAHTPASEIGAANGLNALFRGLGSSIASAAGGAILAADTVILGDFAVPSLTAYRELFAICAGAAVLTAVMMLFVPHRKTA